MKLESGLIKACQKRPVDTSALALEIESELQNSLITEIKSADIGEMVLDRLRDKPALERASWAVTVLLLALCLLSLATGTYNPFIYFRF